MNVKKVFQEDYVKIMFAQGILAKTVVFALYLIISINAHVKMVSLVLIARQLSIRVLLIIHLFV